ncbi:hypothetical protein PTKIN_Ptkin10aG0179300 [Pterospermum kingtungense]
MKTLLAFFIFCYLLLFANLNHARKEPAGDYWRSVMKDEPMPEAIKGLLHEDPVSALDSDKKMNHFVKDFDSKNSFIIYHSIPQSKDHDNASAKDLKDEKKT